MLDRYTARLFAEVRNMYRVINTGLLTGLLCVAAAGCSIGPTAVTTGFTGSQTPTITSRTPPPSAALGGPGRKGTRVAALHDSAPKGSFESARKGALSGRDYSNTQLDIATALKSINSYRQAKGLKSVKLNAELSAAAKAHSRDLAKWDRISHYGSDGSNPWDRVKRSGYKARLAAENVGTGQANFDEVLKGWKESEGHNKNLLLADAEHVGLALVQDPNTEFKSFWTLVLGASM